jgi:hypothetical protein
MNRRIEKPAAKRWTGIERCSLNHISYLPARSWSFIPCTKIERRLVIQAMDSVNKTLLLIWVE